MSSKYRESYESGRRCRSPYITLVRHVMFFSYLDIIANAINRSALLKRYGLNNFLKQSKDGAFLIGRGREFHNLEAKQENDLPPIVLSLQRGWYRVGEQADRRNRDCVDTRLVAINCDGGYTGVKPQHSHVTCPLAHRGTVPHRRLDFIYSNKNNFVQLEDTTIKTECRCSMQRTEQTRVLHHITAV